MQNNENYSKKRRKASKKIRLTAFVVLIFLAIYIPSLINWMNSNDIITDMITYGSIDDTFNAEGVIIRDEYVINAPLEGRCIQEINEGEKVQAGSVIALLVKKDSDILFDKIKSLEERILTLQKNKTANIELFSIDIDKLDNEIQSNLEKILDNSNKGILYTIRFNKSEINRLVRKKASVIATTGEKTGEIAKIQNEINETNALIEQQKHQVVASGAGIVSYYIDGYEELLKTQDIKSLTPERINSLENKVLFTEVNAGTVSSGKPFIKIIYNNDFYVAVVADYESSKKLKMNEVTTIRINENGKSFTARLNYISPDYKGKVILAYKSDRSLSENAGLRKIHADVIRNSYSGLKVPVKALLNIDTAQMTAKLMVARSMISKNIEVKVLGINSEYAIIGNLEPNTINGIDLNLKYVLNPQNIREGQIIN